MRNSTGYLDHLISDDYSFTQQIGCRIQQEGHPGLIAPSARYKSGSNVVIFNKSVLENPRVKCYLTYKLDPKERKVIVERNPGEIWLEIKH
jgi:hypothetical protein